MSSLIRRLQKNIAKGQGWHRDRGTGLVVDSDGVPSFDGAVIKGGKVVANRWPQVSAPTTTNVTE